MHLQSISTKYTFGDVVCYNSEYNGQGMGFISGIILLPDRNYLYEIASEDRSVQGGIEEAEIQLIENPTPDFLAKLKPFMDDLGVL